MLGTRCITGKAKAVLTIMVIFFYCVLCINLSLLDIWKRNNLNHLKSINHSQFSETMLVIKKSLNTLFFLVLFEYFYGETRKKLMIKTHLLQSNTCKYSIQNTPGLCQRAVFYYSHFLQKMQNQKIIFSLFPFLDTIVNCHSSSLLFTVMKQYSPRDVFRITFWLFFLDQ